MRILFIALLFLLSCKKEEQEYPITFTVVGVGNYEWQIGTEKGSGHADGFTKSGTAHEGDYTFIEATGDSLGYVKINLDCDKAGIHYGSKGQTVKLFKQF